MGRFTQLQDNFSSGELSPLIKGRSDVDIYNKGLEECLNFTPLKSGGTQRRSGTYFSTKIIHDLDFWNDGSALETVKDVNIIPYKISNSEQYTVAIIKLDTKITIQCYLTIFGTTLLDGFVGATSSSLTTAYIPYSTDIHLFQQAQSGSLLVLTHDSGIIPPLFITRKISTEWNFNFLCAVSTSAGNFNLSTHGYSPVVALKAEEIADKNHDLGTSSPVLSIPFSDLNSSQTEFTPNLAAATIINSYKPSPTAYPFFTSNMIGARVKTTSASLSGVSIISAFTSTSQVTVVNEKVHIVAATKLWEVSAWNSEYGFPRCVIFHEQRLIFGSTKKQPDTFWASEVGNFRNFMLLRFAQDLTTDQSLLNYFGTQTTADPFNLTVAANESNKMQWITSTRNLYIGTLGNEYSITGASGAPLSGYSFSIKPESNKGSSFVQPVIIDGTVIYTSVDGQRLLQLKYSEANGSVVSKDLSIQGEKIDSRSMPNVVDTKFKKLSINKSSTTILALRSLPSSYSKKYNVLLNIQIDGTLEVLGWSTYLLGGEGFITSMLSLQNNFTALELNILCVRRDVLGVPAFSLEILNSSFEGDTLTDYLGETLNLIDISQSSYLLPIFVDCATTLNAPVAFTAISHPFLKSVVVEGLADGLYFTATLNASGNATLATAANTVIFGLPYTSRIKTLPVNRGFETQGGSAILSTKRIDKLFVKMRKSRGMKFGPSDTNLLDMEFTGLGSIALFTGDKSIAFKDSSDEPGQVVIQVDKPYPCTILQIGVRGMTSEV